jgi:predicted acetyltransferase
VVGTLRSFTTDPVAPGGTRVVTSALTNVTVSPTHRRQGLLTNMITRDLNESKERGEVLSALIAAEYPIYGRFGYGPAVASVELLIEARARFRAPADRGTVELVDPSSMRDQLPPVYETARRAWPGAVPRPDRWWDVELGLAPFPSRDNRYPRFLAVSRDPDGTIDGFVTYTTEEIWERNRPVGILRVEDLIGVDDAATARLWRYCLEIDWIHQVRAFGRSVDELLPWLLVDARLAFEDRRGDLQWVRVLDPAAALAGRRCLCAGSETLEIVDPFGLAAGRFTLEGGPDGAQCRPTTSDADLVLAVDVLGAIYLGGVSLLSMARGGGVEEITPGALARADAMFRGQVAPWCPTSF